MVSITSLFNFKNRALKQNMGNVQFAKLRLFLDVHVLYCFQYFAYRWRVLVVLSTETEIRRDWLTTVTIAGLCSVRTPWCLTGMWTQFFFLPTPIPRVIPVRIRWHQPIPDSTCWPNLTPQHLLCLSLGYSLKE